MPEKTPNINDFQMQVPMVSSKLKPDADIRCVVCDRDVKQDDKFALGFTQGSPPVVFCVNHADIKWPK